MAYAYALEVDCSAAHPLGLRRIQARGGRASAWALDSPLRRCPRRTGPLAWGRIPFPFLLVVLA